MIVGWNMVTVICAGYFGKLGRSCWGIATKSRQPSLGENKMGKLGAGRGDFRCMQFIGRARPLPTHHLEDHGWPPKANECSSDRSQLEVLQRKKGFGMDEDGRRKTSCLPGRRRRGPGLCVHHLVVGFLPMFRSSSSLV